VSKVSFGRPPRPPCPRACPRVARAVPGAAGPLKSVTWLTGGRRPQNRTGRPLASPNGQVHPFRGSAPGRAWRRPGAGTGYAKRSKDVLTRGVNSHRFGPSGRFCLTPSGPSASGAGSRWPALARRLPRLWPARVGRALARSGGGSGGGLPPGPVGPGRPRADLRAPALARAAAGPDLRSLRCRGRVAARRRRSAGPRERPARRQAGPWAPRFTGPRVGHRAGGPGRGGAFGSAPTGLQVAATKHVKSPFGSDKIFVVASSVLGE
jgi:hypothetical protein